MGQNSRLESFEHFRSELINFHSLQNDIERKMGQACVSIEWVNEGGGNQVFANSLSNLTCTDCGT